MQQQREKAVCACDGVREMLAGCLIDISRIRDYPQEMRISILGALARYVKGRSKQECRAYLRWVYDGENPRVQKAVIECGEARDAAFWDFVLNFGEFGVSHAPEYEKEIHSMDALKVLSSISGVHSDKEIMECLGLTIDQFNIVRAISRMVTTGDEEDVFFGEEALLL